VGPEGDPHITIPISAHILPGLGWRWCVQALPKIRAGMGIGNNVGMKKGRDGTHSERGPTRLQASFHCWCLTFFPTGGSTPHQPYEKRADLMLDITNRMSFFVGLGLGGGQAS
jgi:hypothetical protein